MRTTRGWRLPGLATLLAAELQAWSAGRLLADNGPKADAADRGRCERFARVRVPFVENRGGNVEKLFTIQPGARVEKLRLRVNGTKSLRVDSEGALVASFWIALIGTGQLARF